MAGNSKKMVRFQWRFAILAACVATGVIAGIISVPWVVAATGMAGRYAQLDAALKSPQADKTDIILLGNSTVMNGLDARQLNALLGDKSHAWNFSTEGQRMPEAIMIMQRLGSDVKTVVWGSSYAQLIKPSHDIPLNVTSKWDFADFTPCEELQELSRDDSRAEVFADYWSRRMVDKILPAGTARDINRRLKGRWVLRHFIDTRLREILRKDMDMARMERDLYFPNPFTKPISQKKLDYLLKSLYKPRTAAVADISPYSRELIELAVKILRAKNIQLVFVLMPEHPYQTSLTEAGYHEKLDKHLRQLLPDNVIICDFHNALARDEFIDTIHADKKGAAKLTKMLAEKLEKNGGVDR